ncbi:MAG: nucleotidyltransferase domain-containing protein [Chloroflexi bacterium]|nr:nucleotidyltransferase domain-containing protein [Chloroflexota bacterium]MDL1941582.1 nucleotidyltransferase domain-containing protein [Chloroflexi bacterium CFX2]
MKYGLSRLTVQRICSVLERYPQVEKAVLYGSRAKGNHRNGSDIDLTLHGGADLTLNVVYKILDDLDDLLLPYIVDLSVFKDIRDPDVIEHIRRVGVVLYRRGEALPEPA